MVIKKINDREEKKKAIQICDGAFLRGLCKRENFEEIFHKINRYADFFIAYEEEVVGYAAMYNNDYESKTAYITMIGVCIEFQRKHIGSLLMEKCISSACENGMKFLRLEVYKENFKAIEFYKKYGFVFEKKCSDESEFMILNL